MSNGPSITAAIVTFDRPHTLARALDAILAQTVPPDEIIVSDDGWRESTAALLRDHYPMVRHLRGPGRGLSANRNHAIREATGTWILLQDDDFACDRQYVEYALAACQASAKPRICHARFDTGQRVVEPQRIGFLGFVTKPASAGSRWPQALAAQALFAPTALLRQLRFDEVLRFYCEEQDFSTRAHQAGVEAFLIAQCVNRDLAPDAPSSYKARENAQQDVNRLYYRAKAVAANCRWPSGGAALFVGIGLAHHALAMLRRHGPRGLLVAAQTARSLRALRSKGPFYG